MTTAARVVDDGADSDADDEDSASTKKKKRPNPKMMSARKGCPPLISATYDEVSPNNKTRGDSDPEYVPSD